MQNPDEQPVMIDQVEERKPMPGLERALKRQEEAEAAAKASQAYSALADNLTSQSASYPDDWVRNRYANAAKAIRRLAAALSETAVTRRN